MVNARQIGVALRAKVLAALVGACCAAAAAPAPAGGGEGRLVLEQGDARCVVETRGARVVSYSAGGHELVWMPEASGPNDADSPMWRHGGIPLAWPWFGRLGAGFADIHGYAWKSDFKVVSRTRNAVVLELETEAAHLEYAIRLDDALTLELRTRNMSRFELPLGVAFHPYFRVGARDATVVEGFDAAPVAVTNAVDRKVFFDAPVPARHVCVVRDRARALALRVTSEGATGLNLWNPGTESPPPGLDGDAWRAFVAVEPFAMGMNRFLVLAPGARHVLKMSVSAERD